MSFVSTLGLKRLPTWVLSTTYNLLVVERVVADLRPRWYVLAKSPAVILSVLYLYLPHDEMAYDLRCSY